MAASSVRNISPLTTGVVFYEWSHRVITINRISAGVGFSYWTKTTSDSPPKFGLALVVFLGAQDIKRMNRKSPVKGFNDRMYGSRVKKFSAGYSFIYDAEFM